MLSRLFVAALCSPAEKGLTSWLLFMMFIGFLLLSHVVIRAVAAYLKVVRRRKHRVLTAREGESTRGGIPLSLGGLGFSPRKF